MGVLPAYQGRGIGERLKVAQRAWALGHGLDCIAWTYDPLEAPNAYLNIAKLGGVARSYERDAYGDHGISSSRPVPSDRLFLEWELDSERVRARLSRGASHPDGRSVPGWAKEALNAVTWHDSGWPVCGSLDLRCDAPALILEVPPDWQGLRRAEAALAQDWRTKTRAFFEYCLERGYTVVDYASLRMDGRRRNYYLLEKEG
jgi:predicted GNAT superfamily acetyltransferase